MSRSIEWQHDSRRLVIPVTIIEPGPIVDFVGYRGTALVDTGSTTSAVTPRVVRGLALQQLGKRPLGSAQGEGQAERYLFRIAFDTPGSVVPEFPFLFEEIIGFELTDSFQFDALIGMDILRQCDLLIRRDGFCQLSFG